MWGKNIRVVIIPSFLATICLGQSIYLHLMLIQSFNLSPLATWLASAGALLPPSGLFVAPWGNTMALIGLAASMSVNTLMTGLIVFNILKKSLEIKWLRSEATSVELTLGSLSSTGGTKFRHIIFIIIESGMALFAIQLARVVVAILVQSVTELNGLVIALDFIIGIHEMLNVIIIRSVHFHFFCFTDNIYLAIIRALHQQ
jgi:hypothetical protein